MMITFLFLIALLLPQNASLLCSVTAGDKPVADADVVVGGRTYETAADGEVRIPVTAGTVEVTVAKEGGDWKVDQLFIGMYDPLGK